MKRRTFGLVVAGGLALPRSAIAQERKGSEIVTTEPEYDGVRANAPIPAWQHVLNEGGADGAGLCVIASNVADGLYQDVPELRTGKGSDVWRRAKAAEGGYYAEKFERLLRDSGFETAWFQAEGTSAELLDVIEHYNGQGLPLGVTINFGERYRTASNPSGRIHHMVSLVHLDRRLACYVDNNFPGEYFWITREEFAKRFEDGPRGWLVVILYGGRPGVPLPTVRQAGGAMLLASAAVMLMRGRR